MLENVVVRSADARGGLRRRHDYPKHPGLLPIEFMPTAKVPCTGTHPNHIVFLTCDAYGVLPPISKLTPEQAMCTTL
ncbi:MAG: phosphoenolpyruvate carboxykinase (ATP) [Vampirovibrionales bacterium]